MGRYFDFTPVKPWAGGGLGDIGRDLGDLGEFIAKDKAEKTKQELERQRTAAYKAQVDAQVAGVKRQALRDQVTDSEHQQDRMRDTTARIASAVSAGRYGEAGGLAEASRFEDPRHPGQMVGVGFQQQPVGPAPVAPQEPEAEPVAPERPTFPSPNEADYYKVMSPQAARSQAITRALGQSTQPPAPGSGEDLAAQTAGAAAQGVAERAQHDKGQYQADKLAHDVSVQAYDPAFASYQAEKKTYDDRAARPNVELSYPTGQKVTIDPREADQFKDYEAEHKAAQLLNAADKESDPVVAATMRRQASMIQAQLAAADKGAIGNAATASAAATARAGVETGREASQERIGAGHDRARIIAAKIRGKGGGFLPGAEENRVTTEAFHNMGDVTGKGGLRDQVMHQRRTLDTLDDDPNNTNWTNAIDAMIRTNTGKSAILSQYHLYTGKAASGADALDQAFAWATSGALSDAQQQSLYSSMIDSYEGTRYDYNQALKTASEYETDKRVVGSPALRESMQRTLHSAFPGGEAPARTATHVPGKPNLPLTGKRAKAAAAAAAPAAPPPADETKLTPTDQGLVKQAREQIAKKGPHAASAKAYLDHLGLQ